MPFDQLAQCGSLAALFVGELPLQPAFILDKEFFASFEREETSHLFAAFALRRFCQSFFEVFGLEHFVREEVHGERVADGRAERLQKIERERGPAILGFVIDAKGRIQAAGPNGRFNFATQNSVGIGKDGVDRVVRRAARATFKWKVRRKKMRQFLEVAGADAPLQTAQPVQIRCARRFLDQTIEPCGGSFHVHLAVGGQALEDAFLIQDLGLDKILRNAEAKEGIEASLILFQACPGASSGRRTQHAENPSGPGRKSDWNIQIKEGGQHGGSDLGGIADDHALDIHQRKRPFHGLGFFCFGDFDVKGAASQPNLRPRSEKIQTWHGRKSDMDEDKIQSRGRLRDVLALAKSDGFCLNGGMKSKRQSFISKPFPKTRRNRLLKTESIVLAAVTGESPAVLTETVWALAREKPRVLPHRVIAITTTRGRERLKAELLESGIWNKLRKEVGAKKGELLFGASDSIRVIGSRTESCDLEDIVTAEDNLAAADAILETVRGLTSNPDIRLIASLAGGRKTMSTFMALALTLVGRPEDRLCHVLVNPPFDSPWLRPKFYFPIRSSIRHELKDQSGKTVEIVSSAKARIELAEVPFVPLAKLFERDLKQAAGGYAGLVARLRGRVEEGQLPLLRITPAQRMVQAGERRIHLNAQEFAMFEVVAQRRLRGESDVQGWKYFADLLKPSGAWRAEQLDDAEEWEHLRKLANSIRRKLKQALSDSSMADRLALTRQRGRIEIEWPREKISFI